MPKLLVAIFLLLSVLRFPNAGSSQIMVSKEGHAINDPRTFKGNVFLLSKTNEVKKVSSNQDAMHLFEKITLINLTYITILLQ